MAQRMTLTVNGSPHEITVDDPDMPLLYALRDEIGLNNPRFGCGLGQCGACTVIIDGAAIRSCSLAVTAAEGRKVATLHGVGTPDKPHPLQSTRLAVKVCRYVEGRDFVC